MNNRIKKLMRDAIGKSFNGPDPDGDVKKMYIPHIFVEHFTALIVAECLAELNDCYRHGQNTKEWDNALRFCEKHIKERFKQSMT